MGSIRVSWSFYTLHFLVFYFSLPFTPEFLGVRASTVAGNETDRLGLLEFKSKITYDPLGVLGSWNKSIHFCQWHGVTCSRRHQRVATLDLKSLRLAGSVSPYIGNLSFLKMLNLQNNSFTHEIPSQIGRLRRLEVLALDNNSIGGEIPASISRCSNLVRISLSVNQLMGKIPSEFGSLSQIEFLSLAVNNLTGKIPSSLGNLSSIYTLSFAYNNLVGTIPDSLSRLKNLVHLELGVNMLSGTIPSPIFNISSITIFDVGFNQIQGNIPPDIGFTLPNLQLFSIAENRIIGAIPPTISNATKLEVFQALTNRLTGEVPHLEKLQRLSRFTISYNNLGSGGKLRDELSFLCSLINATRVNRLGINDNNFGGLLPVCISNLSTTLEVLLLNNNKIFGSIPTGIGKLINLQVLDLGNNQLSGTIPPAIGEIQNIGILYLDGNKLSGNIPDSLGNLKLLFKLALDNNFLQGSIPPSLCQCKSLRAIDLSRNILSGTIPPQLIGLSSISEIIDFSRNQLTGSLPPEVGNLKNIEALVFSRNKLSGEIPSSIGSCVRLEQLYMEENLFRGPIPSSFSSLRGLVYLDLSQNNLSGEIPEFLASFEFFQKLNLSYNDFVGVVPTEGVFKNLSAASIMGNTKLCGGTPELKLSKCTKTNLSNHKISRGLKVIISTLSAFSVLVVVSGFIFCWLKWRRGLTGKQSSELILRKAYRKMSYEALFKATDGFSSALLIGAGSFGSVYKGRLDQDGTVVAVKVLNLQRQEATKSFMAECKAWRNIRHRNLVKIVTSCSSIDFQGNDFKALVYEYMPNGSLEKWLHPDPDEEIEVQNLTLLQRISIAIDVASALDYLHHQCQEPILHCDIKPSNVLLDKDLNAHVGDFGIARFHQLQVSNNESSSVGVRGTIGYAAPEYGLGSEVSESGDVYSFGILLLEMVTRKKPTDVMFEGDFNLHNFAKMALPDRVMDIVDPMLLNDFEDLDAIDNQRQGQVRINNKMECLISTLRIGVACSMETPQERMNIANVVHELQSVKNVLLEPGTLFNSKKAIRRQNVS